MPRGKIATNCLKMCTAAYLKVRFSSIEDLSSNFSQMFVLSVQKGVQM